MYQRAPQVTKIECERIARDLPEMMNEKKPSLTVRSIYEIISHVANCKQCNAQFNELAGITDTE